ncbi:hypothetical protein HK102_003526 [Quaeritorhiza haematococci]|nr:hypothetical protein HK102_003526 [Quaeritorhiza haematococci]
MISSNPVASDHVKHRLAEMHAEMADAVHDTKLKHAISWAFFGSHGGEDVLIQRPLHRPRTTGSLDITGLSSLHLDGDIELGSFLENALKGRKNRRRQRKDGEGREVEGDDSASSSHSDAASLDGISEDELAEGFSDTALFPGFEFVSRGDGKLDDAFVKPIKNGVGLAAAAEEEAELEHTSVMTALPPTLRQSTAGNTTKPTEYERKVLAKYTDPFSGTISTFKGKNEFEALKNRFRVHKRIAEVRRELAHLQRASEAVPNLEQDLLRLEEDIASLEVLEGKLKPMDDDVTEMELAYQTEMRIVEKYRKVEAEKKAARMQKRQIDKGRLERKTGEEGDDTKGEEKREASKAKRQAFLEHFNRTVMDIRKKELEKIQEKEGQTARKQEALKTLLSHVEEIRRGLINTQVQPTYTIQSQTPLAQTLQSRQTLPFGHHQWGVNNKRAFLAQQQKEQDLRSRIEARKMEILKRLLSEEERERKKKKREEMKKKARGGGMRRGKTDVGTEVDEPQINIGSRGEGGRVEVSDETSKLLSTTPEKVEGGGQEAANEGQASRAPPTDNQAKDETAGMASLSRQEDMSLTAHEGIKSDSPETTLQSVPTTNVSTEGEQKKSEKRPPLPQPPARIPVPKPSKHHLPKQQQQDASNLAPPFVADASCLIFEDYEPWPKTYERIVTFTNTSNRANTFRPLKLAPNLERFGFEVAYRPLGRIGAGMPCQVKIIFRPVRQDEDENVPEKTPNNATAESAPQSASNEQKEGQCAWRKEWNEDEIVKGDVVFQAEYGPNFSVPVVAKRTKCRPLLVSVSGDEDAPNILLNTTTKGSIEKSADEAGDSVPIISESQLLQHVLEMRLEHEKQSSRSTAQSERDQVWTSVAPTPFAKRLSDTQVLIDFSHVSSADQGRIWGDATTSIVRGLEIMNSGGLSSTFEVKWIPLDGGAATRTLNEALEARNADATTTAPFKVVKNRTGRLHPRRSEIIEIQYVEGEEISETTVGADKDDISKQNGDNVDETPKRKTGKSGLGCFVVEFSRSNIAPFVAYCVFVDDQALNAVEYAPPPAEPQSNTVLDDHEHLVCDRTKIDFGYIMTSMVSKEKLLLRNDGDQPIRWQMTFGKKTGEVASHPRVISSSSETIQQLTLLGQFPHIGSIDVYPQSAVIQPGTSMSVSIKITPTAAIQEDSVFELPLLLKPRLIHKSLRLGGAAGATPLQTIQVLLRGQLTSNVVVFQTKTQTSQPTSNGTPNVLDFGRCSIFETRDIPVAITNKQRWTQTVSFVSSDLEVVSDQVGSDTQKIAEPSDVNGSKRSQKRPTVSVQKERKQQEVIVGPSSTVTCLIRFKPRIVGPHDKMALTATYRRTNDESKNDGSSKYIPSPLRPITWHAKGFAFRPFLRFDHHHLHFGPTALGSSAALQCTMLREFDEERKKFNAFINKELAKYGDSPISFKFGKPVLMQLSWVEQETGQLQSVSLAHTHQQDTSDNVPSPSSGDTASVDTEPYHYPLKNPIPVTIFPLSGTIQPGKRANIELTLNPRAPEIQLPPQKPPSANTVSFVTTPKAEQVEEVKKPLSKPVSAQVQGSRKSLSSPGPASTVPANALIPGASSANIASNSTAHSSEPPITDGGTTTEPKESTTTILSSPAEQLRKRLHTFNSTFMTIVFPCVVKPAKPDISKMVSFIEGRENSSSGQFMPNTQLEPTADSRINTSEQLINLKVVATIVRPNIVLEEKLEHGINEQTNVPDGVPSPPTNPGVVKSTLNDDVNVIRANLNYGHVPIAESLVKTIYIRNISSDPVLLRAKPLHAPFRLIDTLATVSPGDAFPLRLSFDPVQAQSSKAIFEVFTETTQLPIRMVGEGFRPALKVEFEGDTPEEASGEKTHQRQYYLGDVLVGETASKSFYVTNECHVPLTVSFSLSSSDHTVTELPQDEKLDTEKGTLDAAERAVAVPPTADTAADALADLTPLVPLAPAQLRTNALADLTPLVPSAPAQLRTNASVRGFGPLRTTGETPFSLSHAETLIEPGARQEITIIFKPDRESDFYFDHIHVKSWGYPTYTVKLHGRCWDSTAFISGYDAPPETMDLDKEHNAILPPDQQQQHVDEDQTKVRSESTQQSSSKSRPSSGKSVTEMKESSSRPRTPKSPKSPGKSNIEKTGLEDTKSQQPSLEQGGDAGNGTTTATTNTNTASGVQGNDPASSLSGPSQQQSQAQPNQLLKPNRILTRYITLTMPKIHDKLNNTKTPQPIAEVEDHSAGSENIESDPFALLAASIERELSITNTKPEFTKADGGVEKKAKALTAEFTVEPYEGSFDFDEVTGVFHVRAPTTTQPQQQQRQSSRSNTPAPETLTATSSDSVVQRPPLQFAIEPVSGTVELGGQKTLRVTLAHRGLKGSNSYGGEGKSHTRGSSAQKDKGKGKDKGQSNQKRSKEQEKGKDKEKDGRDEGNKSSEVRQVGGEKEEKRMEATYNSGDDLAGPDKQQLSVASLLPSTPIETYFKITVRGGFKVTEPRGVASANDARVWILKVKSP